MKTITTRILALLFMGMIALTIPIRANIYDHDPIGATHNTQVDTLASKSLGKNNYYSYAITAIAALPILLCIAALTHNAVFSYYENQRYEQDLIMANNNLSLGKNKTCTHITVKEGQDFTITAPRMGSIEANFFTPYIPYKALQVLPGKQLEDKDIFQLTALKKGHYKLYIEQHVRLEKNKPCGKLKHDIFVHVE